MSESDLELYLFMIKGEQKKLFIMYLVWIISALTEWLRRILMPMGWSGNPIGGKPEILVLNVPPNSLTKCP